MAIEQSLTDMLRPAVEAAGFELLGLEFVRAGKHSTLRVYIDHENGITVDDCADVSRQVSAVLDVEDPIKSEYYLEVSSPGSDRPLFDLAHYVNVVGQDIELRLTMAMNGRRKFKGQLTEVRDETLVMLVDGETFELAYGNVEKANVVAKFD